MPLFERHFDDLVRNGPLLDLVIEPAPGCVRRSGASVAPALSVKALVDTGAAMSAVRDDVAEALGVYPVGTVRVNTPSSTGVACAVYDLHVRLGAAMPPLRLRVVAAPLRAQNAQFLLGRDILGRGLLVYQGFDNRFTLAF